MICQHGNEVTVILELWDHWDDGVRTYGENFDLLKVTGCDKCKHIKYEVKP